MSNLHNLKQRRKWEIESLIQTVNVGLSISWQTMLGFVSNCHLDFFEDMPPLRLDHSLEALHGHSGRKFESRRVVRSGYFTRRTFSGSGTTHRIQGAMDISQFTLQQWTSQWVTTIPFKPIIKLKIIYNQLILLLKNKFYGGRWRANPIMEHHLYSSARNLRCVFGRCGHVATTSFWKRRMTPQVKWEG